RRLVEPRDRFALRGVENLPVADEIHHAKRRHAGLPRAEEIPGAAKTQVALRDLEAVGRLGQRPEPLSRLVRERRLIEQEAVRLMAIAADTPAKLMELRQAEAFGMLDDHHAGVRDVDADLDDR